MATFTITWDVRGTLNGREYVFNSPVPAPTIALSEVQTYDQAIANTTTLLLWSPTTAGVPNSPSAMDFLYALSTVDAFLEFTCNQGDAAERVFALALKANLPFLLFRKDGFFNFTAGPAGDAFAGVLDVIDQLRARNQSGAAGVLTYAIGKI